MTPKFPEILATFWSDISGFYPSPLDVKISSLFFLKVSLRLQGLTLTTVGLVITYRVF